MNAREESREAVPAALHWRGEGGKETWEHAVKDQAPGTWGLVDYYREWADEIMAAVAPVPSGEVETPANQWAGQSTLQGRMWHHWNADLRRRMAGEVETPEAARARTIDAMESAFVAEVKKHPKAQAAPWDPPGVATWNSLSTRDAMAVVFDAAIRELRAQGWTPPGTERPKISAGEVDASTATASDASPGLDTPAPAEHPRPPGTEDAK